MFTTLAARFGLEAALVVAQKYWKPILFGGIGLATIAYIAYLRWDNTSLQKDLTLAEHNYQQAAEANKENVKTIHKMNKEAALDRQIQALEAERKDKAASKISVIRKELNELPDANARVNAHRDELARRLRELSGN